MSVVRSDETLPGSTAAGPAGPGAFFGRSKDTILDPDVACRLWASSTILRISKLNRAASCSRIARTSSTIGSWNIVSPPSILAERHNVCCRGLVGSVIQDVAFFCFHGDFLALLAVSEDHFLESILK